MEKMILEKILDFSESEEAEIGNKEIKDCRDIKRVLVLEQTSHATFVVAVAIAKNADCNRPILIPAMEGEPICSLVHDIVRDNYTVFGVDYHQIGNIPVAYVATMQNVCGWDMEIPLPLSVIRRYMTVRQKRQFDQWKSEFSETDYKIEFLQIIAVY